MTRHSMTRIMAVLFLGAVTVQPVRAQQTAASPGSSSDLLRQAQQQMSEGKEQEAVASARQAVAASPESYQTHNTLGAMLDRAGQYKEARDAFTKAAEVASDADDKARARRAMAISYGFE